MLKNPYINEKQWLHPPFIDNPYFCKNILIPPYMIFQSLNTLYILRGLHIMHSPVYQIQYSICLRVTVDTVSIGKGRPVNFVHYGYI